MRWEAIVYQWLAVFGLGMALASIKKGRLGKLLTFKIPVLKDLASCIFCVSFWGAFGLSLVGYSPAHEFVTPRILAAVLDGFAGATVSWCLYILTLRIEPEGL